MESGATLFIFDGVHSSHRPLQLFVPNFPTPYTHGWEGLTRPRSVHRGIQSFLVFGERNLDTRLKNESNVWRSQISIRRKEAPNGDLGMEGA